VRLFDGVPHGVGLTVPVPVELTNGVKIAV
jgi:hypothetical protein